MATKKEIGEELFEPAASENAAGGDFPVHTMVRWISKGGFSAPDGSYQNVLEVDMEVGTWILAGYRLVSTHFLGETPEAYGVMYVLSR